MSIKMLKISINKLKIVFIFLLLSLICVTLVLSCRCDSRLGFGTICGHRLGLERGDGCKSHSIYFCDQNTPNGFANEVKDCLNSNEICIFGWIFNITAQDDICAPIYRPINRNSLNSSNINFNLLAPRA
jgi:hypothetical protein